MILDIVQTVINFSNLKNQIRCSQMDKYVYDNLYIYSLNTKYGMSQEIIEKRIFCKMEKLYCYGNDKINNISHLKKTLRVLKCGGDCGISQKDILGLQCIEKLDCVNNYKINSVNHLNKTLRALSCGSSGIDQKGISKLKYLEKIYCSKKIDNLSHLKNTLKILNCSGNCEINQEAILELNHIEKLDCSENKKIDNVNHLIA